MCLGKDDDMDPELCSKRKKNLFVTLISSVCSRLNGWSLRFESQDYVCYHV